MQIGSLRHRVTIQTPGVGGGNPFQTGDSADAWVTVITTWASIQPLTSKEVFQAGQTAMKVSHKITIRYPGTSYSVSAGDQVLYKGRVFELLTGIENPDERNISLALLAYELDPVQ